LSVPTRSKFTADRRQIILEHLSAGCSRRQAAAAAGVDHQTLSRWIERGRTGSPTGRWNEFYRAVRVAEAGHPTLVALTDRFNSMDAASAWEFLAELREPGFTQLPDPPEPITVEVSFAPFTPPVKEGEPDGYIR
jgi:transposase-like protein